MKKKSRLMVIKYQCQEDIINRLKICFEMCAIRYVVFKEYDFTDGNSLYKIYIDKNGCTWEQVMAEVNRVRPTKFSYVSGEYIDNGRVFMEV